MYSMIWLEECDRLIHLLPQQLDGKKTIWVEQQENRQSKEQLHLVNRCIYSRGKLYLDNSCVAPLPTVYTGYDTVVTCRLEFCAFVRFQAPGPRLTWTRRLKGLMMAFPSPENQWAIVEPLVLWRQKSWDSRHLMTASSKAVSCATTASRSFCSESNSMWRFLMMADVTLATFLSSFWRAE